MCTVQRSSYSTERSANPPTQMAARENLSAAPAAAPPASPSAAAPAPDPTLDGQKYAVVIGVNTYAFANNLARAVKDAHDLGKVLESIGFKVLLLTDRTEQKPTRPDDIRLALASFTRLTRSGDTILLYFAGHGFGYRVAGGTNDFVYPMIGTNSNRTSHSL